ncbi:cyclase/dehydrase [Prosthecochloris aestuarii DSM 271]|uniref:Cyclase/dehydrase n=1 Tax=Prosthecochloris aestuarii (strain DSM 271 / SK 413) TaxID=290512 RepID=B4S6W6_PROA2|nr:SRPBCC family protein [Prosthecochloris aestuarii]ACF47321.1 cyclase/dehydrase [Prosthecochloris aestuarii DSM 271]
MQIEHSIVIKRPLAEVEAYLTDISNDSQWQEDVFESAITTTGPIGEGTAGYEIRNIMGFPMRTEWVITGYLPGKSYTFTSTQSMVPYEGTVEFSAVPGGTSVTYRFTMIPQGLMAILDPVVSLVFTPRFMQNLEALRILLEEKQ